MLCLLPLRLNKSLECRAFLKVLGTTGPRRDRYWDRKKLVPTRRVKNLAAVQAQAAKGANRHHGY
jgi:hypothetical protein